jgi:uncharacterized protein DUF955
MSEDYRVPKRSDNEIREEANQTKEAYGVVDHRRPVNIIRCLQSGWIPTRQGRRKLVYNVVDDEEMGGKDGRTEFTHDAVIISVKRSVHEKAGWGDGRSRMTLAHELAHGVMHYGATVFRSSSATGTTELSRGNAAGSAEHQAKVFASAFLIDDKVAEKLESAEEISAEFVVSLEAAEICLKRLKEAADRSHSAERVRQSNEAFQARMRKPAQQLKYTGDFCQVCGNATMLQVGIRLICHTCRNIGDPN